MHLLIALSHVAAFLLLAFALVLPGCRRPAMVVLAVAAVLGLGAGSGMPGNAPDGRRSLTTVHTFAGFDGPAMEISMVRFPTGTVEAEGWQWPLPFAGFAALWIVILLLLGRREDRNPWLLPLVFAVTATAAWLGMQFLAAPEELVQPVGLDRFLWPAGLSLALLASRRAKSLLMLFVMVSSGTMLARLPAALFSKYASDNQLGSCLDISSVRDIVNPVTQMQFEPRLVSGSGDQQFWLIWLEHVIFYPAIYLLSLFGIAFGAYMFHRHGPDSEPAPPPRQQPS